MPPGSDHHGPPPGHPPDDWRGWWGPVNISPRDVYDQVVALRETVGPLVGRLTTLADDVVDHETRLRAVEETRPRDRLARLEEQVAAVQARLFPLPVLACLFGAGSLVLSILSMRGK